MPDADPPTRRILVVEDEPIFVQGLRAVLGTAAPDLEVVDVAETAEQAVSQAVALQPDLVLLDLRLPERRTVFDEPAVQHGLTAIQRIHEQVPHSRILVLSSHEGPDELFAALRGGARGYISKSDRFDGRELAESIRTIIAGEVFYGPLIAERIQQYLRNPPVQSLVPLEPLTQREEEVLALLVDRKSNQQIAAELFISVKTVKTHVSNILGKLQLRRREEVTWHNHQRRQSSGFPGR